MEPPKTQIDQTKTSPDVPAKVRGSFNRKVMWLVIVCYILLALMLIGAGVLILLS